MGTAALGQARPFLCAIWDWGQFSQPSRTTNQDLAAVPTAQFRAAGPLDARLPRGPAVAAARLEGGTDRTGNDGGYVLVTLGWRATARPARGGTAIFAAAFLAAGSLASCSVNVPDPESSTPAPVPSVPAKPTITPGHDADAVAARDLPLSAGGSLAAGVPVEISDGLREVPGWKLVEENVQGQNRFVRKDGCEVTTRLSLNQGALAVGGDDKASTEALFAYLDQGIEPASLTTETLRWGADDDRPPRKVQVLAFNARAAAGGKSFTVLARLFATAGSSAYITAACPSPAALATAKADVAKYLPLVPPGN